MSYTVTEHQTDGTQNTYPFRFAGDGKGYLQASDIVVEMRKAEGGLWLPVTTGWSLSGTNQITFLTPPAKSDLINLRIRRVVSKEVPYATFDRGVVLDMKSLNNSFIHLLDICQEMLDGFFPEGFYVKRDLNMGYHKIINLADGVDKNDAVNKGQLDVEKVRNDEQDTRLNSIEQGLVSNVGSRTVPAFTVAKEGQTKWELPLPAISCVLYINGVFQNQLLGAFTLKDSVITFAEPLRDGDEVYALLGSGVASPDNYSTYEADAVGISEVDLHVLPVGVKVYLDGLRQTGGAFTVEGTKVKFSEPLPECKVTIEYSTGG